MVTHIVDICGATHSVIPFLLKIVFYSYRDKEAVYWLDMKVSKHVRACHVISVWRHHG